MLELTDDKRKLLEAANSMDEDTWIISERIVVHNR
jgi:hypothetical protein